jgi:hypothetical protein
MRSPGAIPNQSFHNHHINFVNNNNNNKLKKKKQKREKNTNPEIRRLLLPVPNNKQINNQTTKQDQ